MAEGHEDRTEAATPKRRERARDEGQVALSREVAPAAVLGTMAVAMAAVAPPLAREMTLRLSGMLEGAHALDPVASLRGAAWLVALTVLPFAAASALATAVAVLGQTGFLLRPAALMPSLGRLSPLHGLSRLFTWSSLGEAGKSVLKFAAVGAVTWFVLRRAWPGWLASVLWSPGLLLQQVMHFALLLLLGVLGIQVLLAASDVLRARLAMAASLRMSRHELREEQREADGDPLIKNKLRRIRLQRARRRMMAAVPRAAVVVTNPTHYAVALAYERGSTGAPRVVAKGVDAMAARIRAAATEARVPLVANPPLARALWLVELDSEIPAELFQAVAEIIAAVWGMRGRRRAAA